MYLHSPRALEKHCAIICQEEKMKLYQNVVLTRKNKTKQTNKNTKNTYRVFLNVSMKIRMLSTCILADFLCKSKDLFS